VFAFLPCSGAIGIPSAPIAPKSEDLLSKIAAGPLKGTAFGGVSGETIGSSSRCGVLVLETADIGSRCGVPLLEPADTSSRCDVPLQEVAGANSLCGVLFLEMADTGSSLAPPLSGQRYASSAGVGISTCILAGVGISATGGSACVGISTGATLAPTPSPLAEYVEAALLSSVAREGLDAGCRSRKGYALIPLCGRLLCGSRYVFWLPGTR